MNNESHLLDKVSLKEKIKYIYTIQKTLNSFEKSYYSWLIASTIINQITVYGAILLSAYLVQGLTIATGYDQLLKIALVSAVLLCLGRTIGYCAERHIELLNENRSSEYMIMQQQKIMKMDYSLIDSPRLKAIIKRCKEDNYWGMGIMSFFNHEKMVFSNILSMLFAFVILAPKLKYLFGSSRIESVVILIFLLMFLFIVTKLIEKINNKLYYYMFHIPTREECEYLMDFIWTFTPFRSIKYENGKDTRIYNADNLMKAYTVDKIEAKEYKDYMIWKPASLFAKVAGLSGGLSSLMMVGAYFIAVLAAKKGGMETGMIIVVAGCLANFMTEMSDFISNFSELGLDARKQIGTMELMNLSDEMYKGSLPLEKRSDGEYEIEFRNVSFKYPGSEKYALHNFNMKLKVGEKLAIVGRNGSGKTTMIKLLCRFYDPDEGEILLNGVNIKKFRHDEYNRLFSVIFQDYNIFSLKLGENVATDVDYDKEYVEECLTKAGFGKRMEKISLDTYLYKDYEDDGIEISGGEAQKIAIARAIYKDAPFILLDEPTAALDPKAESEIYTNIDKIVGNKTAVYISHRLSSCKFCDKIAVFKEGELVQLGDHAALVEQTDGEYAKMWNKQAVFYT